MIIKTLLNKLFGWDYVNANGFMGGTMMRSNYRVKRSRSGEVFYFNIWGKIEKIKDPRDVVWLTCHPSKYFIEWDFEKDKL